MPPKKEGPSKKTVAKAQDKVIEDKTFGLKNKNKSKAVQKYIQGVQTVVKSAGNQMSAARLAAEEQKKKEAQKKEAERDALLSSMFRTVLAAGGEANRVEPRVEAKIDLYTDQRDLLNGPTEEEETNEGWDEDKLRSVVDEKEKKEKSRNKTDKVCMYFLDAVEKRKYGWFWNCPTGESCIYKHCLPPGYVLKLNAKVEVKEDRTLEEILEDERKKLGSGGTPITFESFNKWKADKAKRKEDETEKKRMEEVKKNKGGKGFNILSGRALFKYDPTLFADDEGAVDNQAYEDREEYNSDDEKEERKIEEDEEGEEDDNAEEDDGQEEQVEEQAEEQVEETKQIEPAQVEAPTTQDNNASEEKKKKKNKKKKTSTAEEPAKDVSVNANVFLDEDDVELPE